MYITGYDIHNASYALALLGCILYEESLTLEEAKAFLEARGISEDDLKETMDKLMKLIQVMTKEQASV